MYDLWHHNKNSAGSRGGLSLPMFLGNWRGYAAASRSKCNGCMPSVKPLPCSLAAVAWPAQRFQIAVLVGTAVRFWNDVIHAGGFGAYTIPSAVLAQVLIAREDTLAAYLPRTTIPAFVPTLSRLVVTPAITCVQLAMTLAIA